MGGSGREPRDTDGLILDNAPGSTTKRRPFPKVTVIAAAVVIVASMATVSTFEDSAVIPPIAATTFWLALLTLAIVPAFWAVRRFGDHVEIRRRKAAELSLASRRHPDLTPEPPDEGWSTPTRRGDFWYSYDDRGRQRVIGTMGWTAPHWPQLPLTPFGRKLRVAILALLTVSVLFGFIPAAAVVGPCMFLPCDRFPSDTAALSHATTDGWVLVVPACFGNVRAVSIETYPDEGARTPLWAISSTRPAPLPEKVNLDQTPEGFQQDLTMSEPLPVGDELWIEVRTQSRRFITSTFAVEGLAGEVSSGERGKTKTLDSFTQAACDEVAYEEPQPPILAMLLIALGYLGVPLLTAWLIAHHMIQKRRRGPPHPIDQSEISA